MPLDPQRQYSANDLAADAAAAGTPVSTRLITDWVERGLLDRPRKRGLGRGKGTVATWPESQRQLFLALLNQRRRGAKRQAILCNLPVTVWLDSAGLDREYVPLRQVRRCLATWGGAYRAGPARAARHSADALIEQQGMPRLSRRARRALIEAVVDATGGGPVDRGSLLATARQAFESERFAELWVRTIEARLAAIEQLDAIDDQAFETARLMVNQTAGIYAERQLAVAADEDARRVHALALLNELAGNACIGLLTALGFLELARRQGTTMPVNSPPRPLARPGGMAHGERASACRPKLPRPPNALSSSPTATGSESTSSAGT